MAGTHTNESHTAGVGLTGRLLIALPHVKAGVFEKSVVFMATHDQDHALGLILNKPITGMHARDAIDKIGLEPAVTAGELQVFLGGPVSARSGHILHTADFACPETSMVTNKIGVTSNRKALKRMIGDRISPQKSRLFAGHAQWTSGQLESELRRQTWMDIPATPDLVFDTAPDQLWTLALGRLGLDEGRLWSISYIPNTKGQQLH